MPKRLTALREVTPYTRDVTITPSFVTDRRAVTSRTAIITPSIILNKNSRSFERGGKRHKKHIKQRNQ